MSAVSFLQPQVRATQNDAEDWLTENLDTSPTLFSEKLNLLYQTLNDDFAYPFIRSPLSAADPISPSVHDLLSLYDIYLGPVMGAKN